MPIACAGLDELLQHALLMRGGDTPEPTYRLLQLIRCFARSGLDDAARNGAAGPADHGVIIRCP